jgi:phosphohistidine phosphatase
VESEESEGADVKHLYLVRHGIAIESGTAGYEEDARPLTPLGVRRMKQISRGLRTLELPIDRILTSPLARAQRTAEILATGLHLEDKLESCDELAASHSAKSIREWLTTRTEPNLMLVGHNPAFEQLVGLLAGGSIRVVMRKGGVAAFSQRPDGKYILEWLARPRLIRRLAD